jgi:hypothetical protein
MSPTITLRSEFHPYRSFLKAAEQACSRKDFLMFYQTRNLRLVLVTANTTPMYQKHSGVLVRSVDGVAA